MISGPQSDLRHTGHIGYDGAMFGDVAFIGDNYNKLPFKVTTPQRKSKGFLNHPVHSLLFLFNLDCCHLSGLVFIPDSSSSPNGSAHGLSRSVDTLDADCLTVNSQSQLSLTSGPMTDSYITGLSLGSHE